MVSRFHDQRDWFFDKRYGMFMHWGLYSLLAWHEQHQWRRQVRRKRYAKLIHRFKPVRFDPEQWLDLAEEVGMQYICLTAKHHDGFCLWDTSQTEYQVKNAPYGKDIVGMLANACHRRAFPLCLYYSVVDWHHPNYPNQNRSHELPGPEEGDEPDIDRYVAFMREQVRELCTHYGEIHGIWWDGNCAEIRDPSINAMIRSLQPKAVINDRGADEGDYATYERELDEQSGDAPKVSRLRQGCNSLGTESWGYREDEDYYADRHLMESLDRFLAEGGTYLLNVGPMADGTIAEEDKRILRTIGKWYRKVEESFDGAEPAFDLIENRDVLLTRKGNVLYVHLFKQPLSTCVLLKPLDALPRKATLLNSGAEVEALVEFIPRYYNLKEKSFLRIRNLPVNHHTNSVMVLKLEFDDLPTADTQ